MANPNFLRYDIGSRTWSTENYHENRMHDIYFDS